VVFALLLLAAFPAAAQISSSNAPPAAGSAAVVQPSAAKSPQEPSEEPGLPTSSPEAEGIGIDLLTQLTSWVKKDNIPIFSILISRHGKLVYELYTSQLTRNHAHYLMSVTKSVLSSLVGVALDRHLLRSADMPVTEVLPRDWFKDDADFHRFQALTLKDVMAMSALDCPDPPRDNSAAAQKRQHDFLTSRNRVAVPLTQPLLKNIGETFQYNDENPAIVAAMVAVAAGKSPFDFANEALFGPMGFRNQEWMHQDGIGVNLGGYGLRLRPVDMQKFGNLYLNQGLWQGKRLLSADWVRTSFTPCIRTTATGATPDYGWFWWRFPNTLHWTVAMANGWKGQRIFIVPAQELVVTITSDIEGNNEDATIARIMNTWIFPAVKSPVALPPSVDKDKYLAQLLNEVQAGNPRWMSSTESRMVPSVSHKEKRRPFRLPQ
jgi:CubicO group peptidase (beta-lactamase class C family)